MFLVDTSVWIQFLRGSSTQSVERLEGLLDNPLATGICDQIYLEILQGARDADAFDQLQGIDSLSPLQDFVWVDARD